MKVKWRILYEHNLIISIVLSSFPLTIKWSILKPGKGRCSVSKFQIILIN